MCVFPTSWAFVLGYFLSNEEWTAKQGWALPSAQAACKLASSAGPPRLSSLIASWLGVFLVGHESLSYLGRIFKEMLMWRLGSRFDVVEITFLRLYYRGTSLTIVGLRMVRHPY